MPIITLTTDYGTSSHYTAILKGQILQVCPDAQFIDICHNINRYDIVQGAFLFSQTWSHFPDKTIHLISINDFPSKETHFVGIHHQGHCFLGSDNGFFSLVFDPLPDFYACPAQDLISSANPLPAIFARMVQQATTEPVFPDTWEKIESPVQRLVFQPVTGKDHIRGSIVYIDAYDNAIINISRDLFENVGKNRPFQATFRRHDPITALHTHYHEVPIGVPLCRFNSHGLMEIAINKGSAATLLGMQIEDTIYIEFQ